jgi:hypothetical protein
MILGGQWPDIGDKDPTNIMETKCKQMAQSSMHRR